MNTMKKGILDGLMVEVRGNLNWHMKYNFKRYHHRTVETVWQKHYNAFGSFKVYQVMFHYFKWKKSSTPEETIIIPIMIPDNLEITPEEFEAAVLKEFTRKKVIVNA